MSAHCCTDEGFSGRRGVTMVGGGEGEGSGGNKERGEATWEPKRWAESTVKGLDWHIIGLFLLAAQAGFRESCSPISSGELSGGWPEGPMGG